MASLLKIDLSHIQAPQAGSRGRTDSEDIRLNSPRNRVLTRVQTQEGSKSARDRPLPRVTKDTSRALKTARERETHSLNLSPLKIAPISKPGLQLKKVDVFPPSGETSTVIQEGGPKPPGTTEHTDPIPSHKQTLPDKDKRHLHTSPRVTDGRTGQLPSANMHTEDCSRAFTAVPHRPEVPTVTWGSFPQRQALRKQSDGLPDHILLARDRIQVDAELREVARPSKERSPAQASTQQYGFEPDSSAGGSFLSVAPVSPTSSVHNGTANQVLFIPGTPIRTRKPVGTHKGRVDLHAQGEAVYSAGHHSHSAGDHDSRGASGSRNSVRVTLPSAAPAAAKSAVISTIGVALDSPSTTGTQPGTENSSTLLRIVPTAPMVVPFAPTARVMHIQLGGVAHHAKDHDALGGGGKAVGTKALKPIEFLLNTELLERELEQDLSRFSSLYSQQPSLLLQDSALKSPLHSPGGTAAKLPHSPHTPASCAVQQLTVPAGTHTPSSRQPFACGPTRGGSSGQKHRVLATRRMSASYRERIPLSSPMNDSPDKHDLQYQQASVTPDRAPEHPPQTMYPPSPARRRVVNDTLSGQRTAAVSGGLLLRPGQADLGNLLSGSAVLSTALAQVNFNGSNSPKRPPRPVRPGDGLRIGLSGVLDGGDSSVPAPLSPEAQAAVDAARAAALQQMRIPHALSPTTVLRSHGTNMTPAQREEVRNYPRVYFLGITQAQRDLQLGGFRAGSSLHRSSALIAETGKAQTEGSGYDRVDGNYTATVGDHLRYRYEIMQLLGRGSFGEVYRCRDHKSGVDVAVKIIKSGPAFQAQADKERDVLQSLLINDDTSMNGVSYAAGSEAGWHQSLIQLVDSFLFRAHKCLVFPVHGRNLYEYLQDRNFRALPMSFVRRVGVQLFQALAHLRLLNIIHCDIKPENILLKDANANAGSSSAADIVLTDFGSSCRTGEQSFTYIQSRFYRSPEVLLGLPYGMEIDVWSAACILPELRTSYPAFPGESSGDQLACIAEVLGLPEPGLLERSPRREIYFDAEGDLISKVSPRGELRTPGSKSIETISNARRRDAAFVDFLSQCLCWEPARRLTPTQALSHPWLQESTAVGEGHTRSRLSSVEDDLEGGDSMGGALAPGVL